MGSGKQRKLAGSRDSNRDSSSLTRNFRMSEGESVKDVQPPGSVRGGKNSNDKMSGECQDDRPESPGSTPMVLLRQSDGAAAPADGIYFAQYKGKSESLVVYRSAAERASNPERLNLDRRHLTCCPVLKNESRVRLLNYQNNYIEKIAQLRHLPNLIFLDLYNNCIESMSSEVRVTIALNLLLT